MIHIAVVKLSIEDEMNWFVKDELRFQEANQEITMMHSSSLGAEFQWP